MNINLELYKIFYTVAKYKSFSKSANALYVSQSAITQRINSLENQLNCKLFYRMANGVKLTEYGEELLKYVKDGIESIENAEEKFNKYIANKKEKYEIIIQTTSQLSNIYIYGKLLQTLKNSNKFMVKVNNTNNLKNAIEMLSNKEIDLVVFDYPYKVRKKDIEILENDKLEQILYASKDYIEKTKNLNLHMQNKYKFILPAKGSLEREKFDKYCIKSNICINESYEINDLNIRNSFIGNNLGIGLGVKDYIKEKLKSGVFVEIPVKEKLPTYDIYIAKLKNNNKIEQFINIA